jgi:hypothetical protein
VNLYDICLWNGGVSKCLKEPYKVAICIIGICEDFVVLFLSLVDICFNDTVYRIAVGALWDKVAVIANCLQFISDLGIMESFFIYTFIPCCATGYQLFTVLCFKLSLFLRWTTTRLSGSTEYLECSVIVKNVGVPMITMVSILSTVLTALYKSHVSSTLVAS